MSSLLQERDSPAKTKASVRGNDSHLKKNAFHYPVSCPHCRPTRIPVSLFIALRQILKNTSPSNMIDFLVISSPCMRQSLSSLALFSSQH
mmetsp:Transcript_24902/g.59906  ORF Transcript_24902/g.59906 Transcript_24902/m.59906 type:complete len:90 (-) Transcript_24902:54-323(-)